MLFNRLHVSSNMNTIGISTMTMTTEYTTDISSIPTEYGNSTTSPTTTPSTVSDSNAVLGAVCCIIMVVAILANLLVVVVFYKVPSLRSPGPAYLLLSITVANLIVAVLCLIPNTLTLFKGGWILGLSTCKLAAFVSCLAYHLTFHTVGVTFFERYLKICRPTKHAEVFTPCVTLILVGGLCFFAVVLALFPLVGWGEYAYLPTQKQCWISAAGWRTHLNHMIFTLVMALVLPILTSLICLIVLLRFASKTRRVGTLDAVGEEETSTMRETYSRKLKKKERQLQRAIRERDSQIKKTMKRENNAKKDQLSNSFFSAPSSSDEDDRSPYKDYTEAKNRQTTLRYRTSDLALVRSLTWILLLLVVTWVPYLIAKCLETLEPLNNTSTPKEPLLATAFLTYATHALIPIILLVDYKKYRKALLSICSRAKFENKHLSSHELGTNKLTRARTAHNSGIELRAFKLSTDASHSRDKPGL